MWLSSLVYPIEIRMPQLNWRIPPTYLGQFGYWADTNMFDPVGRVYMYPLSWINAVSVRETFHFSIPFSLCKLFHQKRV